MRENRGRRNARKPRALGRAGLALFAASIVWSAWAAPEPVERQAAYLRSILRQADDAYHNQHASVMSDAAYDALRARYAELVRAHPDLAPYDAVGAPPADSGKTAHTRPVLSLMKAYSDEETLAFLAKTGVDRFRVEPKIDGLTLVARYRDGALERAMTRGDGRSGSDVTAAAIASGALPARLLDGPSELEIRGELFLPLERFRALNERRAREGLKPLKSARNTAAGTLRLKDFAEIERRGLVFWVFEIRASSEPVATATEALALARSAGLEIVPGETVDAAGVLAAVERARKTTRIHATDGVVIKVDDRARFEALGATAKHPRGALARKYETLRAETRLLAVEWSKGDSGRLTPVAIFEPVELEGATIQRASLHNEARLRALDPRIGDVIVVTRSGGSVPEVVGVREDARDGSERPITPPALDES